MKIAPNYFGISADNLTLLEPGSAIPYTEALFCADARSNFSFFYNLNFNLVNLGKLLRQYFIQSW